MQPSSTRSFERVASSQSAIHPSVRYWKFFSHPFHDPHDSPLSLSLFRDIVSADCSRSCFENESIRGGEEEKN